MKKIYFLLLTLLISSVSFGQVLLNEFEPNPAGTDPANSTFELKGTPNASFNLWILSIENDLAAIGTVDKATNVTGTFGANGLAVVTTTDLENPSFTIILTTAFTGAEGDDLDVADSGTLDVSSLGTILDAVGVSDVAGDDATLYGASLGGADILFNGQFEPLLAFRDGITGDWYNTVTIDFGGPNERIGVFTAGGTEVDTASFNADPTVATYGAANPSTSTASIDENGLSTLKIYPNPTSVGYVQILSNNAAAMSVTVFDVLGKPVLNQTVRNNRLNVATLTSGIYIMKISQDKATTTKKLVIK
jgi:hypothetical protein